MTLQPDSSRSVRILDVAGEGYRRAFELFTRGTDEKAVTHEYLTALVEQLPRRTLFLDVGAGDGVTTRHVGQYFEHTIAIEPSAPMRQALRRSCPDAVVLNEPIDEVTLDVRADLALCSHVLYYVPDSDWLGTVRRILNWVAPGGVLLIMLQNSDTDCMRMVRHFTGVCFDLSDLASRLEQNGNGLVESVAMITLPTRYRSTNLADAIDVAELMINVPALRGMRLPSRQELESYVVRNFSDPERAICITLNHDILTVRRSAMS
ncbi:MAG: class I SAM-dependent methyltransferase [Actinomycetota bacterium]|nr:class I SAM-dependent methyltransferase [Actinomycetota bacterium]